MPNTNQDTEGPNKQQHHKSDRAGELVVDWKRGRARSSGSALSRSDWVCSNVILKISVNEDLPINIFEACRLQQNTNLVSSIVKATSH